MRESVADEAIQNKGVDCHETANAVPRNDKIYKRFSLCFVASFLLFVVGFGGFLALLWLYDPFWFFHKPYFREQTLWHDTRVSARGLIEQFEFDSIILGTSMLNNMSANQANIKLGNNFINLSAAGSNFYERAILIDFILKTKPIKKIIYSVDDFTIVSQNKGELNAKLYEFVAWHQKLKYYLSDKFIFCALKWSKSYECVGNKDGLYRVWNGYDNSNEKYQGFQSCPIVHKNLFLKQYKLEQEKPFKTPFDSVAQKMFVRKYLVDMIAQNPQIEFYLVVPTNSRYYYRMPFQHSNRQAADVWEIWQEMIRWLVIEIAPYKNAKIYGFDDLDYADNPLNYNDCYHYNSNMHSMQLDAIANSTHILTPQNIDEYLQTMEAKIKAYDLTPLINEIKAWEAEQNATAKE